MLSEWHISPDEILNHWTDERLDVFWAKRNERLRRQNEAAQAARGEEVEAKPRRVSHEQFFHAPIVGPSGSHHENPNALRFKRVQAMHVQ